MDKTYSYFGKNVLVILKNRTTLFLMVHQPTEQTVTHDPS